MGRGKNWTPEEEAWLREKWGSVSIDGICKHLNRTKAAIMVRVNRLGLPPFLESGDYVTMNQLLHALGYGSVHAYHVKSWVEERGFPMKIKMRSSKAKVKVVYLEEFWAWAEQNRSFIDFSKMEPLTLGAEPPWLPEHYRILADGIREGASYSIIADRIGKSEKAIRGRVWYEYFTENADKVRAMLGAGEWGYGAPVPTVRQSAHHARYRSDIKVQIEAVAGILLHRLKQLKKDDVFFQKEVCQHWSLFKGCTMGESDCDACPHFLRIQPQYCCRCGATFLEREKQTFCPACRSARRKQAQKKWARLHAGKKG